MDVHVVLAVLSYVVDQRGKFRLTASVYQWIAKAL